MTCYAVIMAGGSGTRLWPLSRSSFPKFLLPLFPQSLLELSLERLAPLVPRKNIRIVCGEHQKKSILQNIKGLKPAHFILEPVGRNTAPAIGLAALRLAQRDPESVMIVLPADPLIRGQRDFLHSLEQAVGFAKQNRVLITVGIVPRSAHVGYGYIETLTQMQKSKVMKVNRFVEKPDLKTAQEYFRSGNHYWNAGIFVGRASVFLEEIERWIPPLFRGLARLGRGKIRASHYKKLPEISMDYGVMEKSDKIWMVAGEFDWVDVGDLDIVGQLVKPDPFFSVDCQNVFVTGKGNLPKQRLIGLVGVKDLLIADTPDALLIIRRGEAQKVKEIVAQIKRKGLFRHL